MEANIRCIMRAKAPYGQGITKMKVKLSPEQSSTPFLMPETESVYLRRATEGTGELMELVGGSVAWNQIVNATPGSSTVNGITFDINADGSVTVSGTATAQATLNLGVRNAGHANHVRYVKGCPSGGSASTYSFKDGYGVTREYGTGVIEKPSVDYCIGQIIIASGYAISGTLTYKPQIVDLTQLLGPAIADYVYSLEQATAGSGIAWLKKYDLIDDQYHAYSAPTLQSVEATAHVTVGKNMFDIDRTVDVPSPSDLLASPRVMATDRFYVGLRADNYYYRNYIANYSITDGVIKVTTGTNNSYGLGFPVECEPDTQYTLSCDKNGANMSVGCYDEDWNFVSRLVSLISNESATFTTPANAKYITLIFSSAVLNTEGTVNNIQLERGSSATTYVPYVKHTTPLANVTLRGMLKTDEDGNLYYDGDTYEWDGTVTRYFGERAYQAGDESLTDAITDGTNTVYKLTTPTTESADPYTAVQTVEDGGTEEFVTTNGVPVGVVGRFANAVPMEGVDSFSVTANDGTSHTYPVSLSEEIYRGYVDMLTGDAVSDMASIAEYNGETIATPWLSSLDVYSAGATPTNGAQVVYPITPEEVTATITGDPTELSNVVSVSSTEGTVDWNELSEIGIKCIMKRKNPFQ